MSLLATIVIIILPCGHDQSTVLTPSACMHGALQQNRVGLAYIEIVLYMWAGPASLLPAIVDLASLLLCTTTV